jgi:CubicO group peptidase (beta-lactamase class C family)
MTNVQGFCTEEFQGVREAFAKNLDSGADLGASAAVFVDGEPVVDLWGGYQDEARTTPWRRDTIINTFSTTKTMVALAALVLADRGELDLDAPVVRYWPEFGAKGKSEILVRQVLGFNSGLAGWTETVTLEDIYDYEKSCALLAGQAPWWKPGTAPGYHALNIGHLVHGMIVRITGLSLGEFFAREIAGPCGAEYYIGFGPEHDARISPFSLATPQGAERGNLIADRALFNPRVTVEAVESRPWRQAEIGGANGHGNARGVAAAQSVLACGGTNGKNLLSRRTAERVLEPQSSGLDVVLGAEVTWGMGYAIGAPALEARLSKSAAGHRWAAWGGNGGSWAHVDLDARMSVGFVMNRWIEGYDLGRCFDIVNAAYDSVAVAR